MLDLSAYLHSTTSKNQPQLRYRPRGRRMRDGVCVAALRAVTVARGYLSGQFSTLGHAAVACGSNHTYTTAAVTVLKANDDVLLANVLSGAVPLLQAATSVKHAVELIEAFRESTSAERQIFGRAAGPAAVFDEVVVAAL